MQLTEFFGMSQKKFQEKSRIGAKTRFRNIFYKLEAKMLNRNWDKLEIFQYRYC